LNGHAGSNNPAGRPRSKEVGDAILNAALRLARRDGFSRLTVDAIAAEAGVGKPSIYRRWTSCAEIITLALTRAAASELAVKDTGALRRDVVRALYAVAEQLSTTDGRLVCSLFAMAQLDADYRPQFQAFIGARRTGLRGMLESAIARGDLAAGTDVEFLLDELYGPLMYRMLVGHAPIDEKFVRRHVLSVISAFTR
jgi:Transcriptional regulator